MFDTIYTSAITAGQFFTMAAAALVSGLIYSWLMSFRIRSTKRFFLVTTLLPLVVAAVLIAMGSGIAFGMGYVAYGVIILLGLAALYFVIAALPIFEHRGLSAEKLLKVTIPESLEYNGAFDEIFDRYLRSVESVGVKTT